MNFQHLLPPHFFHWCQNTWIARQQNESLWAFATIETIHILGLTTLLAALMLVDFRLLGFGLRRQTVAQISKEVEPLTVSALITMVITGIAMFLAEAERLALSTPFFFKILFLIVALALHFTIHRRAIATEMPERLPITRISACLSLVCWFGIAVAGRAIAFVR